ncbi:MAG: hypothetical protein EBS12_04035 [Flavobacteriia bacterium]|nr:hypothetical protein [Flavobacteriia bacterium]
MKQLFKLSLVFLVFLSIVFQSLSFYIPSFNEEISEIVLIEFEEENEESEKEIKEEENLKNDSFHTPIPVQIFVSSLLSNCDNFLFNYRSPALAFLSPPPEKLS